MHGFDERGQNDIRRVHLSRTRRLRSRIPTLKPCPIKFAHRSLLIEPLDLEPLDNLSLAGGAVGALPLEIDVAEDLARHAAVGDTRDVLQIGAGLVEVVHADRGGDVALTNIVESFYHAQHIGPMARSSNKKGR